MVERMYNKSHKVSDLLSDPLHSIYRVGTQ